MESYERDHNEEYFQTVSKELDTLVSNLKNISLQESDYEMLSRMATSEVTSYLQSGLLKPLHEAKNKVAGDVVERVDTPVLSKEIKDGRHKLMFISNPLQELFASLKEVPLLTHEQYVKLLRSHADSIEVLTNFLDKLESGRDRRLGK